MQTIIIFNREEFRKWLEENHKKEDKVKVIIYKKHTGKSSPSHRELIEEAICFGWIDTTLKKIDEDEYSRNFVKRNEKSRWSENTLSYGKRLLEEGKMNEEGIKYYKLGLEKPTHYHEIPKNPEMPEELKKELRKDEKAREKFEKLPPSLKKMLYRQILMAKQKETKTKRVGMAISVALERK